MLDELAFLHGHFLHLDRLHTQAIAWQIQQNPVVRPDAKVFLSHGVLLKDPPKHYIMGL